MDAGTSDLEWVKNAVQKGTLRWLLRALSQTDEIDATAGGNNPGRRIPNDPDSIAYLRQLIALILRGRLLLPYYNLVLLAILLLFTAAHWLQTRRYQTRWKRRVDEGGGVGGGVGVGDDKRISGYNGTIEGSCGSDKGTVPSSSSSSTLRGTPSPSELDKCVDVDVERRPLLGASERTYPRPGRRVNPWPWTRISSAVRAWLTYQPRPIPIVNRALPSNATSVLVACYVGLHLFFHLYGQVFEFRYMFAIADRAGLVFIANLPLLYLLAAKNQPLHFLTGYSYEGLNILHRRVGELMCFEAFVHFAGIVSWELFFSPDWLRVDGNFINFLRHPLILLGLGALVSYETVYFTSLGSFRQRWYELFLASHVVLQALALAFLWLHFFTSRPYVAVALVIFLLDRLAWRLGLRSAVLDATLTVLEDGETVLLSADWDVPAGRGRTVRHGWRPADHVFVTVPALGGTHALQAHPFTIASAAPTPTPMPTPMQESQSQSQSQPQPQPQHAWLSLLVRARAGFTVDLLGLAHTHGAARVRLDGPYGSSAPLLGMLRAADEAVLVAGGSGVAVLFPLAWALVMQLHDKNNEGCGGGGNRKRRTRTRRVRMVWVTHDRLHRDWVPRERLDELVENGLELELPGPTDEVGRPDVGVLVGGWADGARDAGVTVGCVVSGPDGLNRDVRNACAGAIGRGADVELRVEKFGW